VTWCFHDDAHALFASHWNVGQLFSFWCEGRHGQCMCRLHAMGVIVLGMMNVEFVTIVVRDA